MITSLPTFSHSLMTAFRRRCWFAATLAATGICLANATRATAQAPDADRREYAIKAAFLFHFTQFITWPESALSGEGEPLRIAVFQPNPFGQVLEQIVEDKLVQGRPIEIRYINDVADAEGAQIVFIPQSANVSREIIDRLSGQPVLLVGEDREFIRNGGMVALVRTGERVAIIIDRDTLQRAGLDASSRLLRLAQTVGESKL